VPLVHVVDGSSPRPSDKPLRPLSGADPHLVEPKYQKSFELTAVHGAPTEQSASFRNTTVDVSTTDQFVRLISGSAAEGDCVDVIHGTKRSLDVGLRGWIDGIPMTNP